MEEIKCPKCGKPVTTDPDISVYQPIRIDLSDMHEKYLPMDGPRYVEVMGRYCCERCRFCFIIEEGF